MVVLFGGMISRDGEKHVVVVEMEAVGTKIFVIFALLAVIFFFLFLFSLFKSSIV